MIGISVREQCSLSLDLIALIFFNDSMLVVKFAQAAAGISYWHQIAQPRDFLTSDYSSLTELIKVRSHCTLHFGSRFVPFDNNRKHNITYLAVTGELLH